jgi:hypothetical protein
VTAVDRIEQTRYAEKEYGDYKAFHRNETNLHELNKFAQIKLNLHKLH